MKNKTDAGAGPDVAALTRADLEDCGWGECGAPPCPVCEPLRGELQTATADCGHVAWPYVARDARGFIAVVAGKSGTIVQNRSRFATREDAAHEARLYAAAKLRDLALHMLTLESAKVAGFQVAQIELTGPIVGVDPGLSEDPIAALRMALEQGLCADPEAAAEVLVRMTRASGGIHGKA